MSKHLVFLTALWLWAGTALAADPSADAEIAFLSKTLEVTLLNEGGKYVAVDLKHIPQGGGCRMDQDAAIVRVGPGDKPRTTKVRFVAPQTSSGGCPFFTIFDLPDEDYATSRANFLARKDDAEKRWEQIKKDLSDKWGELFGSKQ